MPTVRWFILLYMWWSSLPLCAQHSDSATTAAVTQSPRQPVRQAKEFLRLAKEEINEGNPAAALALLSQAITLQPDLGEAYFLRAGLRRGEDDLIGAIVDYSVVLHLQPDDREAQFQRALTRYEAERYASAREDFQSLLDTEGGETHTVYFKGSADQSGFVASAVTTMQSDLRSDLLNYIGLCYWHTQHFVQARAYFGQAITYAPQEPTAYANQGLTYEATGDTLQAIDFYRKALQRAPDHPVALRNLSSLARQLNDATLEAEVLFGEAHDSYDAWLQKGMYQHRQKDYANAIRSFTEALRLSPLSAEVLIQRGFSYEKVGALQEASDDYSAAIRLDPRAVKAYSNRGNVHFRRQDYSAALKDYNRTLVLDPDNATALYNRGLTQHRLGNRAAACQDLQRAAALGNPNAARPLAKICDSH